MALDIELLKTFIMVADTGSFSEAGRRRNKVQSAISWQIKKLEDNLSATLFLRSDRKIQLTDSGKKLYNHAKNIISLCEKVSQEMKEENKAGFTLGTSDVYLGNLIKLILENHYNSTGFNADINIICGYSDVIWNSFREGNVDVVVTQNCPDDINAKHIMTTPLVWVKGNGADVSNNTCLATYSEGCADRHEIISKLANSGFSTRIHLSATSFSGISSVVESGFAISAVPKIAMTDQMEIVAHPRLPTLKPSSIVMAINDNNQNPHVRAFAETAENWQITG